ADDREPRLFVPVPKMVLDPYEVAVMHLGQKENQKAVGAVIIADFANGIDAVGAWVPRLRDQRTHQRDSIGTDDAGDAITDLPIEVWGSAHLLAPHQPRAYGSEDQVEPDRLEQRCLPIGQGKQPRDEARNYVLHKDERHECQGHGNQSEGEVSEKTLHGSDAPLADRPRRPGGIGGDLLCFGAFITPTCAT